MPLKRMTDEDIQAYIDGTLPPIKREYIEQALLRCPDGRETLDEYRSICRAIKRLKVPERVPGFADGVMAKLPISTKPSSRLVRFWYLAASFVAALILTVIAVSIDWQPVLGAARRISYPEFGQIGEAALYGKSLLARFSGLLPYAAVSLLAITFFNMLDRLFVLRRQTSHDSNLL